MKPLNTSRKWIPSDLLFVYICIYPLFTIPLLCVPKFCFHYAYKNFIFILNIFANYILPYSWLNCILNSILKLTSWDRSVNTALYTRSNITWAGVQEFHFIQLILTIDSIWFYILVSRPPFTSVAKKWHDFFRLKLDLPSQISVEIIILGSYIASDELASKKAFFFPLFWLFSGGFKIIQEAHSITNFDLLHRMLFSNNQMKRFIGFRTWGERVGDFLPSPGLLFSMNINLFTDIEALIDL